MGNDIGERVSLSDISDSPTVGTLPHPTGGMNYDPFATAQSVNTPFNDPLSAAKEKAQAKPVATAPVATAPVATKTAVQDAGKRPVPPVAKVTKKETDTLRRFREVLGVRRIKVAEVLITRVDPDDEAKNLDVKFALRGVTFEDYQWVLEKSVELQQHPGLLSLAFKLPFCAIGVAGIGIGSDPIKPIWEVLGFEPEESKHVADPMFPHMGLRFAAAEAMLQEFGGTFFDTIEELYTKYEASVDSQYLPKKKAAVVEEPPKEVEETPIPLAPSV